jgi:hypothetical protein
VGISKIQKGVDGLRPRDLFLSDNNKRVSLARSLNTTRAIGSEERGHKDFPSPVGISKILEKEWTGFDPVIISSATNTKGYPWLATKTKGYPLLGL